jgi:hypothetical protein
VLLATTIDAGKTFRDCVFAAKTKLEDHFTLRLTQALARRSLLVVDLVDRVNAHIILCCCISVHGQGVGMLRLVSLDLGVGGKFMSCCCRSVYDD